MESFPEFLKTKGLSPISIRNYHSQVNNMLKQNNDITKFPELLISKPIPIRRSAILQYLEYLNATQGIKVAEIAENVRKIRVRQEPRKEMQTLQIEEGTKLIKHLLDSNENELALICMIAYDSGARIRAILGLKKKHIDIAGNEVFLNFLEKRKKRPRRLITQETWVWLEKLVSGMDKDDYIFFGKKRVSQDEIDHKYYIEWSRLQNISRKLFGKGVSFHWLRRGAAKMIYDRSNNDLVATSEFLGHEDPKVTKAYLKVQAQEAERIIRKEKRGW